MFIKNISIKDKFLDTKTTRDIAFEKLVEYNSSSAEEKAMVIKLQVLLVDSDESLVLSEKLHSLFEKVLNS